MSIDLVEDLLPRGTGRVLQWHIERVQAKDVTVRLAIRGTGAAVANIIEVITTVLSIPQK